MNEKKTVQAHRCKDDIKMQIMCVWCDDVPCMGLTERLVGCYSELQWRLQIRKKEIRVNQGLPTYEGSLVV